ncbi:MAG: DNA mismatch repair endonuclease MutL, partial [Candidatus Bipolaricaulia bacterium]
MQLAIQRHTTSKIATEQDLERITTLGFRGEALAAIAEISKVAITSRERGSEEATSLEATGGEILLLEPAARPPGTTVEVRQLFYNTPARRKHLRTEKTENYHVMRTMRRFILAEPQVHFQLNNDGRTILDVPPSADLRERVAALYGAEFARALIDIHSGKVLGLIGRPEQARASRRDQFIFVN